MTLLTHAHLLDRYGPLLTEAQLGEVLHLAPGTLRNQRRRLGIPVILGGKTPLFAAQDVADYLERTSTSLRATSTSSHRMRSSSPRRSAVCTATSIMSGIAAHSADRCAAWRAYSAIRSSSSSVGRRSRLPPPPISPRWCSVGRAAPTTSGTASPSTAAVCRSTVPRRPTSVLIV